MTVQPMVHSQRHLVHVLIACVALLLLVAGIAIGLVIRQFTAEAAPTGITACVNNYTGAVRMSPYGATTCNSNESKVTWSASDTHGIGETIDVTDAVVAPQAGYSFSSVNCPSGYVPTGGGFANSFSDSIVFQTNTFSDDGLGWVVRVYNPNAFGVTYGIRVRCALP